MFSVSKSKKRLGLRFSVRLGAFYAILFILGYLVAFVIADYLIRRSIASNERAIVSERLAEYRAWFNRGRFEELRGRFREQSRNSSDLLFVRIAGNGRNTILFSSPKGQSLLTEAELREVAGKGRSVVATLRTESPPNVWTVASTALPGGYLLQAGRISTGAFGTADGFRRYFLWAVVPFSLFAILGGGMLSFQAMKPVRDLTDTAADIIETRDLNRRVPIENQRGDLVEMGILFNRILDQNQKLIGMMKESLDNTAHDLRTPMTRMRAIAETAIGEEESAGELRDALGACMEESDRVVSMLDTLMDISEAETGVMALERAPETLASMVESVRELYEFVAEDQSVVIRSTVSPTIVVDVDRSRFQQALANLVDNAIKYSGEGGVIEFSASEGDDEVEIRISDNGEGIPVEVLPRIWERLYRGDQSRSRKGLGLGLSLVKAIVDAHGGRVEAESQPGQGSTFRIFLPGPSRI